MPLGCKGRAHNSHGAAYIWEGLAVAPLIQNASCNGSDPPFPSACSLEKFRGLIPTCTSDHWFPCIVTRKPNEVSKGKGRGGLTGRQLEIEVGGAFVMQPKSRNLLCCRQVCSWLPPSPSSCREDVCRDQSMESEQPSRRKGAIFIPPGVTQPQPVISAGALAWLRINPGLPGFFY